MSVKSSLLPVVAVSTFALLNGLGCQSAPRTLGGEADIAAHADASSSEVSLGENLLMVKVAAFAHDRPAGLAVSSTGRVFVTFPWERDQPGAAVGEVVGAGEPRPYPNATWNQWDGKPGPSALRAIVSAQALTITRDGGEEFLWVLDSGNPRKAGVVVAGPKLFKIDLSDDSIANVYYFDHERDFAGDSELSDVRIDPARRVAYLSDAAHGGVYVVDLKRRTTRKVDIGQTLAPTAQRSTGASHGLAGLELSADRAHLYYHARGGHTLYQVDTASLLDPPAGETPASPTVRLLGSTGSAMDGMTLDPASGDLYLTAMDHRAVFVRRAGTQQIQSLVADDRLQQPDSIALAGDGYLYLTTARRRDAATVAAPTATADAAAGYVLKVSLHYLQQAAIAEEQERVAQQALEESQEAARVARAQIEAARTEAVAEAARAAEALAALRAAAEAVTQGQFELARTQEAAADQMAQQEAAAARARADLASAQLEADRSRAAAAVAAGAARVAELRAAEAEAAVELALAAADRADRSDADARVAAEAHRLALQAAATAWKHAGQSRQLADKLQDAAEAQQARATTAADAWQQQQVDSQPALAAVQRAQRRAELAAESRRRAQLAEIEPASPPAAAATELADVPTPTP